MLAQQRGHSVALTGRLLGADAGGMASVFMALTTSVTLQLNLD